MAVCDSLRNKTFASSEKNELIKIDGQRPIIIVFLICFEKLIFLHVFNIRKPKRIAKFDGIEPRRCEDIKELVALEIDPKTFGTFEKRVPGFWQGYGNSVSQLLRSLKGQTRTPVLLCTNSVWVV